MSDNYPSPPIKCCSICKELNFTYKVKAEEYDVTSKESAGCQSNIVFWYWCCGECVRANKLEKLLQDQFLYNLVEN